MVSDNILETVKQLSDVEVTDPDFDLNLLIFINMTMATLAQIGVESSLSSITEDTEWTDYLPDGLLLHLVKAYFAKKVKLNFDPPTGSLLEALKESVNELESRISYMVDPVTESSGQSLPDGTGYLLINS